MNKAIITIVLLAVLGLGGYYFVAHSNSNSTASTLAADDAAITLADASFAIENMTCVTCPVSVRKAMMRVDGVKEVEVDFDNKIASVTYDASRTNSAEIAAASTDVGYPATEIGA